MEQVSARSCLCAPCHPPAQPESVVCSVSMLADLDTTTHASGFAEDEAGHWNLGRLAAAPGSVLDDTVQVAGVSSPWLYVGGLFASFCWHTEDLWMYSCNHLHEGAPKIWYCVPAKAASRFEKATRSLLPALFSDQPDLLYQLVAMVAPADLAAQGALSSANQKMSKC